MDGYGYCSCLSSFFVGRRVLQQYFVDWKHGNTYGMHFMPKREMIYFGTCLEMQILQIARNSIDMHWFCDGRQRKKL